MQAQKENGGRETFTQAFVKIYKQEGVPGLWRVNKVSLFFSNLSDDFIQNHQVLVD